MAALSHPLEIDFDQEHVLLCMLVFYHVRAADAAEGRSGDHNFIGSGRLTG